MPMFPPWGAAQSEAEAFVQDPSLNRDDSEAPNDGAPKTRFLMVSSLFNVYSPGIITWVFSFSG